jgi:hypothetical protein
MPGKGYPERSILSAMFFHSPDTEVTTLDNTDET